MKLELSSGLAGVAGEYFVAAELSRHGFIASVTLRNSKGIDILAVTHNKTSMLKFSFFVDSEYRNN
jgi:hypothetical protein